MNLLLDTQALLWWREGSRKLGPHARAAIETEAATVRVSAASAWELAIKSRTGRLTLSQPLHLRFPAAIKTSGFVALHVTSDHAIGVASLPDHHADPFDRLLIVQARMEGLSIVTSDSAFDNYDVRILDARK
jgi:PIN domain nuclease of toxin-antitoxin system